jgi:predicted transcriptional regulator
MDVQQQQHEHEHLIKRVVRELLEGIGTITDICISMPKELSHTYKRYTVTIQFEQLEVIIIQHIRYDSTDYYLFVNKEQIDVDTTMRVLLERAMLSILDKVTIRNIVRAVDSNVVSYVHVDLQIPY